MVDEIETWTQDTYNLNATYDSNLFGPIAGWDVVRGFAKCANGFSNPWLCDVLNQHTDDSYLFLGGAFTGIGGGIAFPRATFALDYDTDGVYTTPSGGAPPATGETDRTTVQIPPARHTWKLTFRWRVVGGTPIGRSEDDDAILFTINFLSGGTSYVRKTWAQSSPHFRTDTVIIKNDGRGGPAGTELGHASTFFSGQDIATTAADPPFGPNYLPTQLAWMEVSGPFPIEQRVSAKPGTRRAHFI